MNITFDNAYAFLHRLFTDYYLCDNTLNSKQVNAYLSLFYQCLDYCYDKNIVRGFKL